ncbi:MAG: molybdenum cofactor biosynthesis protein, partial [Staphylococcus epidermidis]|nr:molybdenum cofactor biosynthesis protein [Staphylococcus epidermidis]
MHKHQHQNIHLNRPIHVAILTVSDTRDYDSDKGGQLIQSLINQH